MQSWIELYNHNLVVECTLIFKNTFPPYVLEHILSYLVDYQDLIDRILTILQPHPFKVGVNRLPRYKDCRELLPTEWFTTRNLTEKEQDRFSLLKKLTPFNWDRLFDQGLFIAGGAALFVLDNVQCLKNLGDIDIWVPNDKIKWVKEYLDGLEHTLNDFDNNNWIVENIPKMTITDSIIYFATDTCYCQFLLLKHPKGRNTIENLLLRFDYEMNQCAISGETITTSSAFDDIIKERKIVYINLNNDNYKNVADKMYGEQSMRTREQHRTNKICRKGFKFPEKCSKQRDEVQEHKCHKTVGPHDCSIDHHRFKDMKRFFDGIGNRTNYTLLLDNNRYDWKLISDPL